MSMNNPSEYAYFYNSDNRDRVYDSDSMCDWLTPFFVTGVFNGGMQVLAHQEPDFGATVQTGFVNIEGKVKHYYEPTEVTFAIPDSEYDRIDTVVVERNDTERDFLIKVITGTPAVTPVATPPVREGVIYQLVLAEIYVRAGETEITQAEITDKRADSTVCGWVTATVHEMPFDQFAAQFESYFEQFKDGNEADFLAWFDRMKDQLSEDAAGHLQLEIDDLAEQMSMMGSLYIDTENYIAIDYDRVRREA